MLGWGRVEKNWGWGGREDLTEPHFKKEKRKKTLCDWLVGIYQYVLAHVTARVCVCFV